MNPTYLDAINLIELEAQAREKLPPALYDYIAGGANDESTLRANRAAFGDIALHYRVLVDVSQRTLITRVLDQPVALPVLVAPMAWQGEVHPEGELATARAARAAGTIMLVSTLSSQPIEAVVREAGGQAWYQLYFLEDRALTRALVERAEAAGCRAVVLTVDVPMLGRRERDVRNQFVIQLPAHVLELHARQTGATQPAPPREVSFAVQSSVTWKDLEWLRTLTDLPVLVKGLVRPDDAVRAAEHGAAGVIVSNHGGRQLDSAPPPISVLPRIVDAVDGRIEVLMDSGIRRGTDVVKALAYGARAVLLGRPVLWGLASGGEQGVADVLALLAAEVDLAMALCGCRSPGEITRELVESLH